MRRTTSFFFFFNDTATTEIYTLSLHDALPISAPCRSPVRPTRRRTDSPATPPPPRRSPAGSGAHRSRPASDVVEVDRKSTRLNSSHDQISYAVFCLKKKN